MLKNNLQTKKGFTRLRLRWNMIPGMQNVRISQCMSPMEGVMWWFMMSTFTVNVNLTVSNICLLLLWWQKMVIEVDHIQITQITSKSIGHHHQEHLPVKKRHSYPTLGTNFIEGLNSSPPSLTVNIDVISRVTWLFNVQGKCWSKTLYLIFPMCETTHKEQQNTIGFGWLLEVYSYMQYFPE